MQDPPEAEARAWLAKPLVCDDPEEWVHEKLAIVRLACGLTDKDGLGTGLLLEFIFRRSPKTGISRYKFTVFKLTPHGRERVYQLDIEKLPSAPKNPHSMPHEHFGEKRINGPISWLHWSYEEILFHFCRQANVEFKPTAPKGPEVFELRG